MSATTYMFDGERSSFHALELHITSIAATEGANTERLRRLVARPAQVVALGGFLPDIVHPGNGPDLPNNATQAQLAVFTATLKQHDSLLLAWNNQARDDNALRGKILASLPASVKRILSNATLNAVPDLNIAAGPAAPIEHRPIKELMALLRQTFGQLTVQDLTKIRARLNIPFSPATQTMDQFIESHYEIYHILDTNQEVHPTGEKIQRLRTAVLPCGLYHVCLTSYDSQHPRPADQTFENFAEALRNFQPLDAVSTGHMGYVNEARHSSTTTSAEDFLRAHKLFFCWTHGLTYHSSANCKQKAIGHDVNATFNNRCGSKASDRLPPFKPKQN